MLGLIRQPGISAEMLSVGGGRVDEMRKGGMLVADADSAWSSVVTTSY